MVEKIPSVVSALITPMHDDRSINYDALQKLVAFELKQGVQGFYCCGSSAEGLLLETDERKQIAQSVSEVCKDAVPFIVHTGSLGTKEAIELSVHAQQVGAQAVSLIPPIYYHYSQQEVEGYYSDVAEAIDLGIIIYNIPQFTGISFSKESPLLKQEKIIGIKHTSMNLYDLERLSQAFDKKVLFNGFDEVFLFALAAGAQSTIGTTVNVCPRLFKGIYDDFHNGAIVKAQQKQHLLNDFVEAVVKEGIFSSVKYCMSILGVESGPCRKPFKALDTDQKKRIEKALGKIENYV